MLNRRQECGAESLNKYSVAPEIYEALSQNAAPSLLAEVLKRYAYRQIGYLSAEGHHFMLTILDMVDWSLLASRLLAKDAQIEP